MNKKLFLSIVLVACMAIAYVATVYPIATIAIGTCSLPFIAIWLVIADGLKKDREVKEREKQWKRSL